MKANDKGKAITRKRKALKRVSIPSTLNMEVEVDLIKEFCKTKNFSENLAWYQQRTKEMEMILCMQKRMIEMAEHGHIPAFSNN